ncbi:unnamed protein product [Amoebophrya sp. A25]|nr:unnamed protein product [Amoebophrya sp. A25]|eukprot:GSA25T00004495001.1
MNGEDILVLALRAFTHGNAKYVSQERTRMQRNCIAAPPIHDIITLKSTKCESQVVLTSILMTEVDESFSFTTFSISNLAFAISCSASCIVHHLIGRCCQERSLS